MPEQWEETLAEVLGEAHPVTELGAGWERKAMVAMEKGRPVRRGRRWVAVAAIAVVALVGLGFVPVPMGGAKGALDKALAQATLSSGTHITGRIWGPVGEWRYEQWYSKDGFGCYDLYQDDNKLVQRWIYEAGTRIVYPRVWETEPERRYQALRERGEIRPENESRGFILAPLIGPQVDGRMEFEEDGFSPLRSFCTPGNGSEFRRRLGFRQYELNMTVQERVEGSLLGGSRIRVDVEGDRKRDGGYDAATVLGSLGYPVCDVLKPGDKFRVEAVIGGGFGTAEEHGGVQVARRRLASGVQLG